MKPEVLVLAASPSAAVMEQLDRHFECHHAWRQPREAQADYIRGVAAGVRGLLTTGAIGVGPALLDQLPAVEIVAVNGIGTDAVALEATRARGIFVTNTPGVLTDDVADLALTLLLAAARPRGTPWTRRCWRRWDRRARWSTSRAVRWWTRRR